MNTTTAVPQATAPPRHPFDYRRQIAEAVVYLRVEQQCGASHIPIEMVLALLGAAPGPGKTP